MDVHRTISRLVHGGSPGDGHGTDGHGLLIAGRQAEAYDRLSGVALGWLYRSIADRVTTDLPSGGEVVDVGTGPGRLLVDIARLRADAHVVGVDPSADMVEHALRRATSAGVSGRVETRVASAESLPFPDASVDVVVSSLSSHHWGDPALAVTEQARVLRPGGQLWIVDLRGAFPPEVLEALRATFPADALTQPRLGFLESSLFACHRAVRR